LEIKKILANTSFLALSSFIKVLAGIARAKLNAIMIGAEGIGIVNQLSLLTQKLSMVTLSSMNHGVVKQIAESEKKSDLHKYHLAGVVKTYFLLILLTSVIMIFLFSIFRIEITKFILGDVSLIGYIWVIFISLPIVILNSIPVAILKGYKKVKEIAMARSISVIVNLIIFIPLIVLYSIKGAIILIPISFLSILIFNTYFTFKSCILPLKITKKDFKASKVNKKIMYELLTFSATGILIATVVSIADLYNRSLFVNVIGIESIGIYSPILTWSGIVLGLIVPTMYTYIFPRMSEIKDSQVSLLLNDVIRISLFLIIPLLMIGIPFRFEVINLFYSEEFVEAANYLPYHFFGLIFYLIFYSFSMALAPKGYVVLQSFLFISYNLLISLLITIYINNYGLIIWAFAFLISNFVFSLIYYLVIKRKFYFKFDRETIFLIVYAILSCISIIAVSHFGFFVSDKILGLLLLLFVISFLKKNEKNYLILKINKAWSYIKK
jgi:O-antigen/teichoic acid export membrane protein